MIRLQRLARTNRFVYLLLLPVILIRRLLLERGRARFFKTYHSMIESVEGGSLTIHVPDFSGSFEIDFRSHILMRLLRNENYEPNLVKLINAHIDYQKDVIDVGANIGLFTVLFSKTISDVNKVLAVEPTPLALYYLRQNVQRNGCLDSVIVFEGVAKDTKGDCKINVIPGMEEYSSLGNITHPAVVDNAYEEITVNGDTIDNLVERFNLEPGFIKIDTEGSEYHVLKGALRTIQKTAPIILSELSDDLSANCGANSQIVIELLQDNGYEIRDANDPEIPIKVPFEGNIIAIPRKNGYDRNIKNI